MVTTVLMTHIVYKVLYYFYVLFESAEDDCVYMLPVTVELNLALHRPVRQSSTGAGGTGTAERAVDGNR